jgi:hypothetical protein
MSLNALAFLIGSLLSFPTPIERLQGAQIVNVYDHSLYTAGLVGTRRAKRRFDDHGPTDFGCETGACVIPGGSAKSREDKGTYLIQHQNFCEPLNVNWQGPLGQQQHMR